MIFDLEPVGTFAAWCLELSPFLNLGAITVLERDWGAIILLLGGQAKVAVHVLEHTSGMELPNIFWLLAVIVNENITTDDSEAETLGRFFVEQLAFFDP